VVYEETVVMSMGFDEALGQVKEAFAEQGFGTLTEIDVQHVLRSKIGKEMGRYVIVGACNPDLAGRALDEVPQIGVLLPCNVVVREVGDGVLVEALDPGVMATVSGHEGMRPIADEARQRVSDALDRLQSLSA
jgi:uncharacterized protein (DUF302 family)